ncbi:hypothetical protein [Adhaeribacter pallidiroseus]|uniref:Uncharacterized protein n=1 Tax=Adhaeribacter pallidiroseus TaxID=2072847 RepID=A0A369QBZ0_9BACT|nr:hypothetical protein [Adhaeribacter pallidiroseus]RDC61860.1 hypothetical protein AHMF7616_00449 [Adhaeribacter pallidiroseus]
MEGLLFTIFEDLDIPALSHEECQDSLYYLEFLLEQEDNPESFIKYQMLKINLIDRLSEISKPNKLRNKRV